MQDYVSSNKIKENKYKILRMSLLLGADEAREETLNNFEDASRDIDAMNDEIYLKDLEGKFYDTLSLEEEEKKLAVLVDYIGGRVEQRISLLSDFANVTGYDLQGLPSIKYYDKLDDYKDRLKYIREYLSNTDSINKLTAEIEDADKKLNDAYMSKATAEECNLRFEDVLQKKFNSLVGSLEFFQDVNEENIEEKLKEVMCNVEDSKKSLDIFTKSFATLSSSGISSSEEEEYLSYVEGAQDAFYNNKEQEFLLRIYHLLMSKYSDYNQIMVKREEINDILYERLNLRKTFRIPGSDLLSNLYDLLERQYEDIKKQSGTIEKIEALNNDISVKKESLNEFEQENQKVEILSLLREYSIIDTYSDLPFSSEVKEDVLDTDDIDVTITDENDIAIDDIDLNNLDIADVKMEDKDNDIKIEVPPVFQQEVVKPVVEEAVQDNTVLQEEVKDNQVIGVKSSVGIDLDLVHSKASKVMKRVGEMLGIKSPDSEIVSVSSDEVKEDKVSDEEIVNNNLFFDDDNNENEGDNISVENPLFSNNIEVDESGNETVDSNSFDPEFSGMDFDSNDFWFPSDTPDALNELPDLEISSDNFFVNNNVSDLQFPDLNIDFGNNGSEGNK